MLPPATGIVRRECRELVELALQSRKVLLPSGALLSRKQKRNIVERLEWQPIVCWGGKRRLVARLHLCVERSERARRELCRLTRRCDHLAVRRQVRTFVCATEQQQPAEQR